jgi:hypothetical protein
VSIGDGGDPGNITALHGYESVRFDYTAASRTCNAAAFSSHQVCK